MENQSPECEQFDTPGGTKYWVPYCDTSVKPYIGQWFNDYDTALSFYKEYGRLVGFDIRKSTTKHSRGGNIDEKYIVCSREGSKNTNAKGKKNAS